MGWFGAFPKKKVAEKKSFQIWLGLDLVCVKPISGVKVGDKAHVSAMHEGIYTLRGLACHKAVDLDFSQVAEHFDHDTTRLSE